MRNAIVPKATITMQHCRLELDFWSEKWGRFINVMGEMEIKRSIYYAITRGYGHRVDTSRKNYRALLTGHDGEPRELFFREIYFPMNNN